jgi:putative endonuclease
MGSTKAEIGRKGEELALRHLKRLGYRIVEQNYRCPLGEVDIVAREGDTLVFVEVKTRRYRSYGLPRDEWKRTARG